MTPDDNKKITDTEDEKPEIELWDRETVLKFFGGTKPISISTLYKGITRKRYPKPVDIGGVRWIASECRDAVQRMIGERDGRKRITRQGDKRLHQVTDNT